MMTTAVRWMNPDAGLVAGPHSVDRLFEQLFGYGGGRHENGTQTYALPIDIVETDDAYQLYATVAGGPQDRVEITVDNGVLSPTGPGAPPGRQGPLRRHRRPPGQLGRQRQRAP